MQNVSNNFELSGLPKWEEIAIVPRGPELEDVGPCGSPGEYEVSFGLVTYAQKFAFSGKMHAEDLFNECDSYIELTQQLNLLIKDSIKVRLVPNKLGRLGHLTLIIEGRGFRDSVNSAYVAVAPFLSHWSFVFGKPILFNVIKAKMVRTSAFRMLFFADAKTIEFSERTLGQKVHIDKDILGYLSLYRESLNSSLQPFFQVFMLHRIREGILKTIESYFKKTNLICDDDINNCFKDRSCLQIHQKIEQKFRNNFAHYNLTKSGLLKQSTDRFDNFYDCIFKWQPVSLALTRYMIECKMKG